MSQKIFINYFIRFSTKKQEVRFVPKSRLYPAFGFANLKLNRAYVRKDLPKIVQTFVKEHELFHLRDKAKFWLWREIKANIVTGIRHPIGFLVTVIISLQPYRLRLYFEKVFCLSDALECQFSLFR